MASLYGPGTIEVLTPPLKLVAELYAIHVMVWDAKFQQLYSAQIGTTFHVRHSLLSPHFGVFHEAAQWHWEPGEGKSPVRHEAHITVAHQQPVITNPGMYFSDQHRTAGAVGRVSPHHTMAESWPGKR